MFLHDLALIGRQDAFLVEHRLLYAQVADKDEKSRRNQAQLIFLRHLEPLAHKTCQDGDMKAVMDRVLAFECHVVDVRDSLRTRAERQDILRQDFRRILVNRTVCLCDFKEGFQLDEALAIIPDVSFVENRLLQRNGFRRCPLCSLWHGGRNVFPAIFPNFHGDNIPLRQGVDHLLIEHRTLSQEDRHIFLIYCLSDDHAFLELVYCILLQHSACTPSLENQFLHPWVHSPNYNIKIFLMLQILHGV